MPGPAFRFKVVDKAIEGLNSSDPAKAKVLQEQIAFARLGALGPDLLRYVPVADPALLEKVFTAGATGLAGLSAAEKAEIFANPLMVVYELLFLRIVQVYWPIFSDLHAYLDKIDAIAASQDTNQLKAMQGETDAIKPKTDQLTSLVGDLKKVLDLAGAMIALSIPWVQAGKGTPFAQKAWRVSELLRWRKTGAFAQQVVQLAKNVSDPATRAQLLAYAYGYLCSIAAGVAAEPFINNIVGGPYRTHWWRHRNVRNFVDAWTFGRYQPGASIAGDEPSGGPGYGNWKGICDAKLHELIDLGTSLAGPDAANAVSSGPIPPGAMPAALADLLFAAFTNTFAGVPVPAGVQASTFNDAYVGVIAVLWFMTGGDPPMCVPPLGAPPGDCTTPPSWVTDHGSPPSPQKSTNGFDGWTIALTILAILLFLTGCIPGGIAALAGAIANAESGGGVDWGQLGCNLYWLRKLVFDAENATRSALLKMGLAYPMNFELGTVTPSMTTTPAVDEGGRPLIKTQRSGGYPFQMDNSVQGLPDLDFLKFPSSPMEANATMDWPTFNQYADAALDGSPLQNQGVIFDDGTFPTRGAFFGAAAGNAVAIIQKEAGGLVDYNLDGDRGYGWKTWISKEDPSKGSITVPEKI